MILGLYVFCKREFRKREKTYKFCSLFCANNFNRNGLRKVQLPLYNLALAEFVGICLGDGYISKYQIAVTLNEIADRDYIPYVRALAMKLFPGAIVSLIKKTNERAIDVRINSRIAADFLREMGIVPKKKILPQWIIEDNEYSKACVRGLFDTEGSISFKLYKSKKGISLYKQLNFKNTDTELIRFVRGTLLLLKLRPTTTLNKALYLSNHSAITLFRNSIGFGNPKLIRRSLIYTIDDYNSWRNLINNQLVLDLEVPSPLQ